LKKGSANPRDQQFKNAEAESNQETKEKANGIRHTGLQPFTKALYP
jgi:hypothetical protein